MLDFRDSGHCGSGEMQESGTRHAEKKEKPWKGRMERNCGGNGMTGPCRGQITAASCASLQLCRLG
jgi:hypothetical protein